MAANQAVVEAVEQLAAAKVSLSDKDMADIEVRLAGIEVTGERLPPALLKVTNG